MYSDADVGGSDRMWSRYWVREAQCATSEEPEDERERRRAQDEDRDVREELGQ